MKEKRACQKYLLSRVKETIILCPIMRMKSLFLTAFLIWGFHAWAQNAGTNQPVQWSISNQGVLTIKGNGPMMSYAEGGAPWSAMKGKIKVVTVQEGVTTIGSYAFANCKQLNFVVLPKSIERIEHHAFKNCNNLTSLTIPSNVTYIGPEAFCKCAKLQSVILPQGLKSISDGMFDGCTSLLAISIPGGATKIGARAFASCKALKDCIIPLEVMVIGNEAFESCGSLKDIIVPDKVRRVEQKTFYKCSSLEKVVMGNALRYIGSEAFNKCPLLTDVYCLSTSIPKVENDPFGGRREKITLWVLNKHYYALHEYWQAFQLKGDDKEEPLMEEYHDELPLYDSYDRMRIVNAINQINVRTEANPNAPILGTMHNGDTVYVDGVENEAWGKIQYQGRTGYVSMRFLSEANPDMPYRKEEVKTVVTAAPEQTPQQEPAIVYRSSTTTSSSASSSERTPTAVETPREIKFEVYYDLASGFVGGQKGAPKAGGGAGGDLTFGWRSGSRRNFLGAGFGLHGYIAAPENGFMYMPIYAFDRYYFSTGNEGRHLFVDVSLGGYVNLMTQVNGESKAGDGGGFFMRVGPGLAFGDDWMVGIGYQMMFEKSADYAIHAGYIKFTWCIFRP